MRYSLAWIVAAVLLSTSAAHTQTGAATDALQRGAEEAAGTIFTDEQIRIIRDVLGAATGQDASESDKAKNRRDGRGKGAATGRGGKQQGLPPGLAKRDTLPPGLQMQLDRGGRLPPGLAKRDLPADLEARLGRPAVGTERVIVDNDVVLIEKGTEIILDIVKDVLTGGGS